MTASFPRLIGRPNWVALVYTMLYILVFAGLLVFFSVAGITKWLGGGPVTQDDRILFFIGVPAILLVLILLIQFLYRPCRAYQLGPGVYEFRSFLGSSIEILFDDLLGFSACVAPSQWKDWNGIVLYLKNGRHIELNDYSLKAIQTIVDEFTANKVPCLGSERSWYTLRKFRYKFDAK